jgi:proline iminopeptidase
VILSEGDVDLYYTTHGSGSPLLLMHGGLGPDHTYFRPWLDGLADVATLIYYDHRGGGRSSRLDSFAGITHQTFVEDADRLREHLGHDTMVLLGHSYGGMLAIEYALRHQDRLDGLVLCCTAPAWDYDDELARNAAARATPAQLESLQKMRDVPLESDEVFGRLWADIQPLYFHHVDSSIIARMDANTCYSAAAYYLSELLLADFNISDQLPRITVPTLIIAGRDDWVTPMSQARRLQAGLPHAQLVVFEKSGHYPFIEEGSLFLQALRGWLESLDR